MNSTFRVARIAGVDVNLHATWLIAFFLITWTLSAGYFPQQYPGWGNPTYFVAGITASLSLFVCVLIHEFAHSLVAIAKGLPVHGITLFVFGGVSAIETEADEAHNEFIIAIVGPLASLVLAGLAWLVTTFAADGTLLDAIAHYLVFINVVLAVFNLVPGFPLDGGRVLRSVVWGVTGDFEKASRVAANVGQFVGFFLIATGVVRVMAGDVFSGLWTALIGWFLNSAAEASKVQTVANEAFKGLQVADLLEPATATLAPDTTVERFVRDQVLGHGRRALPVVFGDRVHGIVSLSDVKRLPEAEWPVTPVTAIMTREPVAVRSEDEVAEALRLIAERQIHQVLVIDDGELKGVLTRAHVVEYLQLREELGAHAARPGRGSSHG